MKVLIEIEMPVADMNWSGMARPPAVLASGEKVATVIETGASSLALDQAYAFLAGHLGPPERVAAMDRRIADLEKQAENERHAALERATARERLARAATVRAVAAWRARVSRVPELYAEDFMPNDAQELIELGFVTKRPPPPAEAVARRPEPEPKPAP